MPRWIVCYDIEDDGRRNKVASILDDYGDRVQRSVFEVDVSERHYHRMLRRLNAVIDHACDSVRIYPACSRCASGAVALGRKDQPPPWPEKESAIIV